MSQTTREWCELYVGDHDTLPGRLNHLEANGYHIFACIGCGPGNHDTRVVAWRRTEHAAQAPEKLEVL